jgi:hypothetical protein
MAGALILAVACGGEPVESQRRQTWVDSHPDLSAEVRDAILAGRLVPEIGMTRDDVLASVGEPDRRETVDPPRPLYPSYERWIYAARDQVAVFQRGVLVTVYRLSMVRSPQSGAAQIARVGNTRRA